MSDQLEDETTEDVSEAFELLQNARRRGVLYTLKRNNRMSVSAIAHRIAAWQSKAGENVPDTESVEISLVHSHLPKLEAAGVVEYDPDEGTAEIGEAARDLDPLLRCTREREPELRPRVNRQTSNV